MRRLIALVFVAAAHALALKTQGLGGGRLALLDFSGAMRGGKRRGGGSRFQVSPRRSAVLETGDKKAGTGRRRLDDDSAQSTRLLLEAPELATQSWYDFIWQSLAYDGSLIEVREIKVPGSDRSVWKAVSRGAPGPNGKDINGRELSREWSTREMAVDDARASFLTHCSRDILETCPIARGLQLEVSRRLKPGPLPRRYTGRRAGILQGPEGAAGIKDGRVVYMKNGHTINKKALKAYCANLSKKDADIVEDYVKTCATLDGGDLVLLRLDHLLEDLVALAADAVDLRDERFAVLKARKAMREQDLANNLGYNGVCLPYKDEERGELSWLASPQFPGREVLDAFRASDRGAAGRGALTNARKDDIRKALYDGATPSRHVFCDARHCPRRWCFTQVHQAQVPLVEARLRGGPGPARAVRQVRPDRPPRLERRRLQREPLVRSVRVRRTVPRDPPGLSPKLVSTQARFQGPQPIFWGGHGDAAEARPRPPLRLGAGDGAFQRHRRELCGRLEALRSALPRAVA